MTQLAIVIGFMALVVGVFNEKEGKLSFFLLLKQNKTFYKTSVSINCKMFYWLKNFFIFIKKVLTNISYYAII